jgi:hypothetical protein
MLADAAWRLVAEPFHELPRPRAKSYTNLILPKPLLETLVTETFRTLRKQRYGRTKAENSLALSFPVRVNVPLLISAKALLC